MAGVHRNGFTELSGSDGAGDGPYRVNIVFVHGLRGHPRSTWANGPEVNEDEGGASSKRKNFKSFFKAKSSISTTDGKKSEESSASRQLFWPKDYLTQDIPQARIWTYGYNADVIGGLFQASNKNSVSQHGRDLAVRLEREIENKDPILFVAHSLGGIIVKDAMHRSEACRSRTRLIVFLGTPHRGSAYAGWGEIASNLARLALQDPHKKIVETLEVNNEVLDNVHEEFKSIVYDYSIRTHSFQEARGIYGMKGLHEKVVDDFSSKLDLPSSLETVESIDANHMQMARCDDRSDPRYRAISGVLKQFLRSGMHNRETSGAQGTLPVRLKMKAQAVGTADEVGGAPINRVSVPYYSIPFLQNRRFVGRTLELEVLEDKLSIGKGCQKLALVGLGGVGKTQVALEFAYRVKESRPEYSIFWAPALSEETFELAYGEIARQCSLRTNAEEEDPKESVRRYLSTEMAGKWLLVVDNADDQEVLFGPPNEPGGITDYLPEKEDSLILFTTRHREAAVSLAEINVIEVQEMDRQEAATFLEKSLIRNDLLRDNAITKELLDELTYLPLAIAQAAAYLNTNQVSMQEYIRLLKSTEQDIISLMSRRFRDSTRYKNSENAVATTWLVSFDQIRKSDVAAADLLSFMSHIEPKAIPRSILPALQPGEQTVHAIGTLCAYAFIIRRGNSDIYDMHRLVHLAARVWDQKQGIAAETSEKATQHLAREFPSDEYMNRAMWREYLPHAFRLLQESKETDIEERYDLCLKVGRCLYVDGRIKESVIWLLESFQWKKGHFAEDHPGRLLSQHVLATAYEADGQVKKAVELLEHVVAIEEKVLAEDHPDRLASQHELAIAYQADGQVEKAVELLEHVVAIEDKVLAEDHPSRLASQHELATAYQADGQVEKAIKLLEHVIAIKEKVLAEDHPSRLTSQHELARAYQADRQVEKAIKLLEYVIAIQEKVLAEDHPSRLASQHVLAGAYQADRQVEKAIKLLEYVIAIQEKVLAEDHPDRLASQHVLAGAYEADGQVEKAIKLLEHVVAIQEKVLAEDHPDRLASQHELAGAYQADRQVEKAIKLLEHVVAIEEKVLRKDHPSRLLSQQLLYSFYKQQRSCEES